MTRSSQPSRSKSMKLTAVPPALRPQAAVAGLLELALALVEEQPAAVEFADVDVGQAVVVHVADRHAHAVPGEVEARASADVLEAAALALPVQPVRGGGTGAGVVEQIDVEEAVVVCVEERAAGADALGHEILAVDGSGGRG